MFSAVLSLLAFDFFFVPPVLTLHFAEKHHLLTGVILLVVGLITSTLASERRRQSAAAATAAMNAREEQLRSSLLSSISHDLRTPLAVIVGSASTLHDNRDRLSREEQDELLSAIFHSARGLSMEVSDVLEMTRLDSGQVKLNLQWYPLEELVGAALERCKPLLASHDVSVVAPPDIPLVRVDAVLFEKLLVNLLENAAKHTPAGTRVTLVVHKTTEGIELRVEDNGPGIPARMSEHLFDKFERAYPESSTSGSGLGLAICRAVAQLHGIRIQASNGSEGGARFSVWIPSVLENGNGHES